jgi:hypothetical protein
MNATNDPNSILWQPASAEEALKIREQIRADHMERARLSIKKFAEAEHAERLKSIDLLASHGESAIKAVFILNGGAILALLALLSGLFGKNDQTLLLVGISLGRSSAPGLYWFAAGATLATVISLIGYLNWSFLSSSYYGPS